MAENMKQERISRGAQREARYRDIVMMSPSQTRERRYGRRLLDPVGHRPLPLISISSQFP
jgi:hypothetical protein